MGAAVFCVWIPVDVQLYHCNWSVLDCWCGCIMVLYSEPQAKVYANGDIQVSSENAILSHVTNLKVMSYRGSLAFGSLILALIQLVRYILLKIQAQMARMKKSKIAQILCCCVQVETLSN